MLDDLVWTATRPPLAAFGALYNVQVNGLEKVDTGRAAVFGVKHSSNLDFPVVRHAFPRQAKIFTTRRMFAPPARYFLAAAGFVPLMNALKKQADQTSDYAALKRFYEILAAKGWIVYAPEAGCFPNTVGEKFFPEFLIKAAQNRQGTYLVGVEYQKGFQRRRHWLPSGITLNIEPYDARNKPKEQVISEAKEALARLSGLERSIVKNYACPAISHPK